ncbi:hypothetical protein IG631_06291 [Alternaria alternata]|nr:hypothetical protein IG631_06291 [Alternaria alternata]
MRPEPYRVQPQAAVHGRQEMSLELTPPHHTTRILRIASLFKASVESLKLTVGKRPGAMDVDSQTIWFSRSAVFREVQAVVPECVMMPFSCFRKVLHVVHKRLALVVRPRISPDMPR